MAITKRESYAKLVDVKFNAELVTKDQAIFNTRFEGEPTSGAVKVLKTNKAVASAYNKSTGLTPSTVNGTYVSVLVDKDYAINELVDDCDADSIAPNIMADRLEAQGEALALQLDVDGLAELVTDGTAISGTAALTKTTVMSTLSAARATLSKANVKKAGRYAIVSPDVLSVLLENASVIGNEKLGAEAIANGVVARVHGFDIYESNNLGAKVEMVIGHPTCATRIQAWKVNPFVENAGGNFVGASLIKGRKVYGHKVTNAAGILVKKHA